MGLDISTHFQHGRSGKFDVPIYSKDLLVCCVSSLITFDTNLNICVYFSLVCTRLFNKKSWPNTYERIWHNSGCCVYPRWHFCFFDRAFIVGAWRILPWSCRVPTRSGKPGKMRLHLENLEISWNFEKFNKYHGKMTWNLEKLGSS